MPLIEPMTPAFASYLSDESRTQGQAEYIAFPRSEEEIAQVLRWCAQHGVPVTAQGGMTVREFADYDQIAGYALEAVAWTVEAGLLTGTSSDTLAPGQAATRVQTAQALLALAQFTK